MKLLLFVTLIGVGLSVGLVAARPAQVDKPREPAHAQVTVVDTVAGMSRDVAKKDLELRLQPPPGKNMLADALYVHVPGAKTEAPPSRKPIAFEGRLTLKDVQVGSTGSVPAKAILAKALYLIADKYTVIDDNNKATFPEPGTAWVRGVALPGKHKVAEGEFSPLAIENGTQPIILTGKLVMELKDAAQMQGSLHVVGRLRRGEQGTLLLEAEKIAPVVKGKG